MRGRNLCSVLAFVFLMTWLSASMVFAQSIMVEKNLFSPDRKPPSAEPALTSASEQLTGLPLKSIQLDGVFLYDRSKIALLRVRKQLLGTTAQGDQDPFPYLTVHEGGSVGDFEVVKIDPSSVTIARNGQQFVISLFAEGKVVPPAVKLPASIPASVPTAPPGVSPAAAPASPPTQAELSKVLSKVRGGIGKSPGSSAPPSGEPTGSNGTKN